MAGLHERWHVVRDFSRAASRQDGDDWFGGIQSEKCRELLTRSFCGHIPHQGMPNKIRRYPARSIPILLEWENAEPAHESTAHQVRAPRPPRPELRANKIDILHALLLQCPREAQMEAGEIREDRKTRPPSCGLSDQAFPHAIQRRELLGNFDDSNQRHFRAIGYQFNSRFPHARPAHSIKMNVRPRAQSFCQTRRIHVTGCFAGGNENLCGWHRFARRNDRLIIGGQRSARSAARWFKGRAQLLILVLKLVKAVINPAQGEQFLVRTLLSKPTFVEYEYAIGMLDGAEPVRNDHSGAAFEQAVQRLTDQNLSFRVHAGGRFIQDQESWIMRKSARKAD